MRELARHAALAAALAGCVSIEYTDGGSGGGGAGGTSGGAGAPAGGSAGEGGEGGCIPVCDADRRCGPDDCGGLCNGADVPTTLAVQFDQPTYHFMLWEEALSAFVSDRDSVHRIDLCDGSILGTAELGPGQSVRGLAVIGDILLVASAFADPDSPSEFHAQIGRYDARTLRALGGVTTIEDFPLWDGAAASDGLWLQSLAPASFAGPGPTFVDVEGSACSLPMLPDWLAGAGITLDGDVPIVTVLTDDGTNDNWRLGRSECGACDCDTFTMSSETMPEEFNPFALARDATAAFVVGYDEPIPQSGTLLRFDPSTLALAERLTLDPYPAGNEKTVDGLVHAAVYEGFVYAAGARHESVPLAADGAGWIVRAPIDLAPAELTDGTIPGSVHVLRVAADEHGVYFTGRWDEAPVTHDAGEVARGFFVQCTHALDCPRIGPAAPTVPCGGLLCDAGEICCHSIGAALEDHCNPAATDCEPGFAAIACNGPDDCGGDECCAAITAGDYANAECRTSCPAGEIELCFGAPSACTNGQVCTPSALLAGHYECQ